MGDLERRLDHPAEARVAFERALAIYDALLKSSPENTFFLVSSTVPLMGLGELDSDRREAYFGRALGILKELDAAGRLEPRRRGATTWLESQLWPVIGLPWELSELPIAAFGIAYRKKASRRSR